MVENLLEQLNDSQREAVEYCDGASLVIAGAGSGKTRVLTYKIAYLLQEKGLKPWNILALTFTNKAAREMKDRIGRLVGQEQARYLQMGTFHSVFSRILRTEATSIGYNPDFTIYDQADARSLVKSIIKEMGLDDKQYKPSTVSDQISMAKNHLVLPDAFVNSSLYDNKRSKVADIYARYVERCRQANAMDFDDLLVHTYLLFKRHEDIRQKYVEKFFYVLVDEYQDTNFVQQQILLQLTRERQQVCVVGDDAQSIYSFRGANIDNILNFRESYDNARLFKLEQNYRSTQLIVQVGNSLISKNERQIPKNVYSQKGQGEKVVLKPAYSDREEAIIVCKDIQRIRRQDECQYSDFAILYRTNAQSRSFEEQMRKDGIPYRIYGGLSFYQRKEIKDVIAYFRVVVNPNDEEALKRIINYPTRGIGDTTIAKIVSAATTNGVSLWTVIQQPGFFHLDLAGVTAKKVEAFRQLIEGWGSRKDTEDAYQLGHAIIMESGVSKEIYSSRNPEDLSRQENLEEFLGGVQDFVESRREEGQGDQVCLSDFLQEVALLTDLDSEGDEDQPKVSLMTIHSAKGLEFPTVFVVGLEENIFPSPMCVNSMRELEEERRLLYVAITRAERHCILTCAQNRFRYGRMEYDTPSRFIRDIDHTLLRVEGNESIGFGLREQSHKPWQKASESPEWMQNPRPVATQFRADPKPRQVAPRRPEPAVEPFSSSFRRQLEQAGDRLKPVKLSSASSSSLSSSSLCAGNVIEHQRFGIGVVQKVEGSGENEKATVEFRNAGTKQLLLKFAKYKILK
ncbi:MAG: UvrD-helicase domain-containing protein [Prevotella sp.]|nr:UvrD-helicase domain-containing protein [Prevotella sp.]